MEIESWTLDGKEWKRANMRDESNINQMNEVKRGKRGQQEAGTSEMAQEAIHVLVGIRIDLENLLIGQLLEQARPAPPQLTDYA